MASDHKSNLWGGVVLLIIGGYFLLRNLGWWNFHIDWDYVWPAILIGLGVWMILKNRNI